MPSVVVKQAKNMLGSKKNPVASYKKNAITTKFLEFFGPFQFFPPGSAY